MSQLVDAVVIGAGPAGSAAAIALGRAGRRVVLLDRHAFPRDKPCGDLIGARALAAARRLGVPVAELDGYRRMTGATIVTASGPLELAPRGELGRWFLAGSDARVVPRIVFDDVLAGQAVRAGAELRRGAARAVGPWDGRGRVVRVETDGGSEEIVARAVIVAGGYGCRISPDVAPRERDDGPPRGIAMRGYLRGVTGAADRIAFCLDRWLLPGYGWVFPLPDGGANVGVGRLVSNGANEQEGLGELWRRLTQDPASPVASWLRDAVPDGRPRVWPLDLGPRRRRLVGDGLLVAGETAGFVGPLTGAGIAFALESAVQCSCHSELAKNLVVPRTYAPSSRDPSFLRMTAAVNTALESGEAAGETFAAALVGGDLSRNQLRPYGERMRRRLAPWLRAELLAQRYLADAERMERLFAAIRPLPITGVLGARLLLHLG
jgi:geranylgeranyl reductase family protein